VVEHKGRPFTRVEAGYGGDLSRLTGRHSVELTRKSQLQGTRGYYGRAVPEEQTKRTVVVAGGGGFGGREEGGARVRRKGEGSMREQHQSAAWGEYPQRFAKKSTLPRESLLSPWREKFE